MAEPEIRFIGDMQRLDVKPGDRFVISMSSLVSAHQIDRINAVWAKFTAGIEPAPKLLILDGAAKLGAIGCEPV